MFQPEWQLSDWGKESEKSARMNHLGVVWAQDETGIPLLSFVDAGTLLYGSEPTCDN
jgi:hypothetical protein